MIQKASLYTQGNASQLRGFGGKNGFETGYTCGGGLAYALPSSSFLNILHLSAVTAKLEDLRSELDRSAFAARSVLANAAAGSAYNMRADAEGNTACVGLN